MSTVPGISKLSELRVGKGDFGTTSQESILYTHTCTYAPRFEDGDSEQNMVMLQMGGLHKVCQFSADGRTCLRVFMYYVL